MLTGKAKIEITLTTCGLTNLYECPVILQPGLLHV